MPHLRMELLGGFRVSLDGAPLTTFESNKVRALLAYLATEAQRPHPRESLAALLWPDWPDRSALNNLRYALSDLRKVIGDREAEPPFLLISREAIQFNAESDHRLDAAEFAHLAGSQGIDLLEQAVALYQGEFLEGFSVSEAAPFEAWARLEGEGLRRCYLEVLHRLAAALDGIGEHERAITHAWRLVEAEPFDEGGQRQLMRLLARSGQRGAALSQYERFIKLLRDELSAEPESVTIQLQSQIKAGEAFEGSPVKFASEVRLPAQITIAPQDRLVAHNLPFHLTSFIGREREMGEIKGLLTRAHLLTLTGIGGTGKTRLALKVSEDMVNEFTDGVWLVELAPVLDSALVEQTVASVLGIRVQPDRDLIDLLVDFSRERHLLIVLDNCEHVAEACAKLVQALLRTTPKLMILATSRVPLGLQGELTYSVPPLALPDPGIIPAPHDLMQYEAVRLFIDRATSARPTFRATNENAAAVTGICQHLDGIPLAIELAAARTRLLTPDQIASRLGDRFSLLTGGSRTTMPRQQTLRATMDWSYDLLAEPERILLNRLSIFTGSLSLEGVEAVCSGDHACETPVGKIHPSQIVDLLGALVDHSLINVLEKKSEIRYGLLETVRQYAFEKLCESGELKELQDRHLAYYLGLAEMGFPHITAGEPEWMERFENEYDNLRSAIEYAIGNSLESAVRFELPLAWFTDFTHRQKEHLHWVMRILELTESWPPGKLRVIALECAGFRRSDFGDYAQGQAYLEASLEMARNLQDRELMNLVMHDLQILNNDQGNWALLHDYAEQHLSISRELGDTMEISCALWNLGEAARRTGDSHAGRNYFEQSLEIGRQENNRNIITFNLYSLAGLARAEGDNHGAKDMYMECAQLRRDFGFRTGLAITLIRLGQIFLQEGDADQSMVLAEESLQIYRDLKVESRQVYCLNLFAGAAGIKGEDALAARLFGAAQAATCEHRVETDDFYAMTYDPIIAAVRDRLGVTDFSSAWAEGCTMALERALGLALGKIGVS